MSVQTGPQANVYDAVVIGSGVGGLTAAAMLARHGLAVLVAERQPEAGGYAHSFQRGPYTFAPAVHWTPQGGPGQLFDTVARHLGIRDRFDLLPIPEAYDVSLPGFALTAPLGVEPFIEAHAQRFPHEAAGIARFVRTCDQVQREIHSIAMALSLKTLDEAAASHPTLFRCLRATVGEILAECVADPGVRTVLLAGWPYIGGPPKRLAFLPFAQMLINQLEGSWHYQGTAQRLVDALAAGVALHGGELVLGDGVRRILVEAGRATGVELDSGAVVRAPVVVSNADARQTCERLVGAEHLPAPYLRRLRRMTPACSAFVVMAATRLDVRRHTAAHETLLYQRWDEHLGVARDLAEGRPTGVWLCLPTLLDPTLAPPGEHLAIVVSHAAYDLGRPWEEEKERFTEALLQLVEDHLPGFRAGLTHLESATPLTLAHHTGNSGGAMYGWENVPLQTGTKRLAHQTPLPGLYLAGHWSLPGGSTVRVFASGVHAAQLILRERGVETPTFAEANLPAVTG